MSHKHRQYRQQALRQRSAILRARVTEQATVLAPAFAAADRVRDIGRSLRQHRLATAIAAAALCLAVIRRPRAAAGLGRASGALLAALLPIRRPLLWPTVLPVALRLYRLLRQRSTRSG